MNMTSIRLSKDESKSRLRARIRANCCEITGLTPAEMHRHIDAIAQTIEKARGHG